MVGPTPAGRILALDYGRRRIGMAVSDDLGLTAQGLVTFERSTIRDDLRRLAELAAARNISLIVIGDPLHMNGKQGRQSEQVREFAGRLAETTGLPVKLWDERWTTVVAQRVLRESGISSRKRARAVDRLSAVLILENYLEWRSHQQPGE